MISLLAAMLLAPVPDTVVVSAGEALRMALERSPAVEAAHNRTMASESRVREAGLLPNPTLNAAGENLGAAVETTGRPAWEGIEGQILIGLPVPIGGDRSAAVRRAEAVADETSALERVTALDTGVEAVDAIARLIHDRALVGHAGTDAAGIQQLADQVRMQADLGRASDGEAARLRLASASAWSRLASARADEAQSAAHLRFLTGLDSTVVVELPFCSWEPPVPSVEPPDLRALGARVNTWEAAADEMRAAAIPDLVPQVGWRRSAGFDALYVGVAMELPVFDRNQGARDAAMREATAARIEQDRLTTLLQSDRAAARQALDALEDAGSRFDQGWADALARAVESAEARYALGEGTLTELLDSRRARLNALSDFEGWRMSMFGWRARLVRRSGVEATDQILCNPSPDLETSR